MPKKKGKVHSKLKNARKRKKNNKNKDMYEFQGKKLRQY
jgi:hypothetical protein